MTRSATLAIVSIAFMLAASIYLLGKPFDLIRSPDLFDFRDFALSDLDIAKAAVLFTAMSFGIVFGIAHSKLRRMTNSQRVTLKPLLSAIFCSAEFYRACFVSPLVFGSIYRATSGDVNAWVAIMIAFQNGFFWQAVLKAR
jgi:hypothetical protein